MKLQQLNEAKYVGKKSIGYLLQNFFDGPHNSHEGNDFYFKKGFQGHNDGEIEVVGIGYENENDFEDEDNFYVIEKLDDVDELYYDHNTPLDGILNLNIYQTRKVHP